MEQGRFIYEESKLYQNYLEKHYLVSSLWQFKRLNERTNERTNIEVCILFIYQPA